jgi:CYTH domain-containing protein
MACIGKDRSTDERCHQASLYRARLPFEEPAANALEIVRRARDALIEKWARRIRLRTHWRHLDVFQAPVFN